MVKVSKSETTNTYPFMPPERSVYSPANDGGKITNLQDVKNLRMPLPTITNSQPSKMKTK